MSKADEMFKELTNQIANNYDKTIIEFLEDNGYKVPDTITDEYLINLKQELKKQDKFLDTLEYIKYEKNTATQYIIPFFNSISNPLSEKTKQEMISQILRNRGVLDE